MFLSAYMVATTMLLQTNAPTLSYTTIIWTRVQTTVRADPVAVTDTLVANTFALIAAVAWTIANPKLGLKSFEHIVGIAVQQNEHLKIISVLTTLPNKCICSHTYAARRGHNFLRLRFATEAAQQRVLKRVTVVYKHIIVGTLCTHAVKGERDKLTIVASFDQPFTVRVLKQKTLSQ